MVSIMNEDVTRECIMCFNEVYCDYEGGYDSDYGSLYDLETVVYESDEEAFDSEDLSLEEAPYIQCPTREEVGEA